MKLFFALILLSLTTSLFASSYVRCSLGATYEIYKGEGLVERSDGTPIALPVEFGFFTNGLPMIAVLAGEYSSISVKALSKADEADVRLTGGVTGNNSFKVDLVFHPNNGSEQILSQSQLSAFNYVSPAGRVVFTKGIVKCVPAKKWDYRPVISL